MTMHHKHNDSKQVASLLKRIAQKISRMSDEELMSFLEVDTSDASAKQSMQGVANHDTDNLIQELRTLDSKEFGYSILERRAPTRASLVIVARKLDLPISKRDTVEKLRDRIVDTTIGYRTRSAAIRGGGPEA